MREKLRSCSGESIAETLFALLISSLALLMLAGAIQASVNVIEKSRTAMGTYYERNNVVSAQQEPGGTLSASFTLTPRGEGSRTVTFGGNQGLTLEYFQNELFSRYPVVSYRLQEGQLPEEEQPGPGEESPEGGEG